MNKIAKLVWFEFGVRVVVDENATEEQIYEAAMDKVAREPRGHICFDHVTEILDDTECPYDPKTDFNYTEKDGYEVERKARLEICKLLNEHGPIEFDWENSDAPSIASTQFEDDLADCYVTKLRAEGEYPYADLHAYYLGEDVENVDLVNDECNIDWLDLLDWVVDRVL